MKDDRAGTAGVPARPREKNHLHFLEWYRALFLVDLDAGRRVRQRSQHDRSLLFSESRILEAISDAPLECLSAHPHLVGTHVYRPPESPIYDRKLAPASSAPTHRARLS